MRIKIIGQLFAKAEEIAIAMVYQNGQVEKKMRKRIYRDGWDSWARGNDLESN